MSRFCKPAMNPPASDNELSDLETVLGVPIPEQLRQSLHIYNGMSTKTGFTWFDDQAQIVVPLSTKGIEAYSDIHFPRWKDEGKSWIPVLADMAGFKMYAFDLSDEKIVSWDCRRGTTAPFRFQSYKEFLSFVLNLINNDLPFVWPDLEKRNEE